MATRIRDEETELNHVHNLHIAIYPCSKFHCKMFNTSKVIAGSVSFCNIFSQFVAIATKIRDIGTKLNHVHNLHIAIYPCSVFHCKMFSTSKVMAGSVSFYNIFSQFVAIATKIRDVGTKLNHVHNLNITIYPCFKFH